MNANVGSLDRQIRITSGIILIALVLTGVLGPWGWIGVVPLATGLYIAKKGHPRLRMRHAEFPITQDARDAWLNAMHQAVNGVEMDAALRAELWIYLEMAANSLVNQPD